MYMEVVGGYHYRDGSYCPEEHKCEKSCTEYKCSRYDPQRFLEYLKEKENKK